MNINIKIETKINDKKLKFRFFYFIKYLLKIYVICQWY